MAQEWCLLYGCLSEDKASEIERLVCKRKGRIISSHPPVKSSKSKSGAEKSKAKKARIIDGTAVVADTGLDVGTGTETLGAVAY